MFIWSAGIAFVLVIFFSAMRIRYSWWPLHPVMFLVWATRSMGLLSHSFFLWWFIRAVVVRLGTQGPLASIEICQVYQRAKPFMIGAVAGNLLGPAAWMIVGMIYYHLTGLLQP